MNRFWQDFERTVPAVHDGDPVAVAEGMATRDGVAQDMLAPSMAQRPTLVTSNGQQGLRFPRFSISALYGAATAHSTAHSTALEKRLLAEQAQRQLDAIFNEWCKDWAPGMHRLDWATPEQRLAAGIAASVAEAKYTLARQSDALRGAWRTHWVNDPLHWRGYTRGHHPLF